VQVRNEERQVIPFSENVQSEAFTDSGNDVADVQGFGSSCIASPESSK
jgi:hypothetical protein